MTVTPASATDVNCGDLTPIIGITSTPVIDLGTHILYAVAKTKEVSSSGTSFYHRLHGVDLSKGKEHFTQVTITASVPGRCGNVQGGNVGAAPAYTRCVAGGRIEQGGRPGSLPFLLLRHE